MRSVLLTACDNRFLYSHQTPVANGNGVKVKTFEEIMQEKRLRKQELEEPKKTAERAPKRNAPARDSSSHTPKIPRKLISLRSKSAASSVTRTDSQNLNSAKENPDHQSKACVNVKQVGTAEEPEQEQPADPKGTDTLLTNITVGLNQRLYPDHDPERTRLQY